ncbi:hypothetical protein QCA50_005491 [Cerrena zonata]|uniref:DUF6589 domain-containing protein n=1 Tax=Cerrena zonata TaxID=2478898 RepID=A0AAW0GFG2_9APHY
MTSKSESGSTDTSPLTAWLQNRFSTPLSEPETDEADGEPTTPCPPSRVTQTADVSRNPLSGVSAPLNHSTTSHTPIITGDISDIDTFSSPIRGRTKAEKRASKANKKAKKAAIALAEKEAQKARKKAEVEHAHAQAIALKHHRIWDALEYLKSRQLTIGDLLLFVVNPENWAGRERHEGLFKKPTLFREVLDFLVSAQSSTTARNIIHEWSMSYTSTVLSNEANTITSNGILRTQNKTIGASFALGFGILKLYDQIHHYCPNMVRLLFAFCTSAKQKNIASDQAMLKKKRFIASALLILLGARSQKNSYARQVIGLYLYATGAQRQVFSVLSHLGVSCSYNTLAGSGTHQSNGASPCPSESEIVSSTDEDEELGKGVKTAFGTRLAGSEVDSDRDDASGTSSCDSNKGEEQQTKRSTLHKRTPGRSSQDGLLKRLSDALLDAVRTLASSGLLAHDSQENGTCATVFPLFKATKDDLQTQDLLDSVDQAPPLRLEDILLSPDENKHLHACLRHTILRVIIQHSGGRFDHFKDDLERTTPVTDRKIEVHKTDVLPLPAMPIDESSTLGNATVVNEIFTILKYKLISPKFLNILRILFGDQLSVARLRGVTNTRVGHDKPSHALLNTVHAPGLFHYQIAYTGATMENHWGDPQAYTRDPGSLCFHNTILDRKPIIMSSPPPYRTCRDLVFVSLYARIFRCLELVSGVENLDELAKETSFEELEGYCCEILDCFANPTLVSELRDEREEELTSSTSDSIPSTVKTGDMVFENASLFLRDALLLREFTDSIKMGDSGRIFTMLKVMTLAYRGGGRPKYAHECLHQIHNLTHVWPEKLRGVILNNWLVNPTGKPNANVPVDLLQEHINYWVKVVYKAHGSNASWEWLAVLSPCIEILRKLSTEINADLGSRQGSKHTSPDLANDISAIIKSLREYRVYEIEHGRVIDSDKSSVPNIVASGLEALLGPLREYNDMFRKLQERRRMTPLIYEPGMVPTHARTSNIPPSTLSAATDPPATIPDSPTQPSLQTKLAPTHDTYIEVGNSDSEDDSHDSTSAGSQDEELDLYGDDELLPHVESEDVDLDMD